MDYTYNHTEIEFARYIKNNAPRKIWWDFTTYVFDYGDFYFQIQCVSEVADTQNTSDEAIVGKLTKHMKPFAPGHSTLVCENKTIEELFIVRVFLYFTTFKAYSKTEQFLNKSKYRIKALVMGKKDPFKKLLSKSVGTVLELTCHPKSEQAKLIDSKYSNLIDCGLLIKIDGKYLKAFVENNGFGFHNFDEQYFYDIGELDDIFGRYQLIKIES